MGIALACYTGFDVINFEINLIFLIKPFLNMTNKSKQKLKYLENNLISRLMTSQPEKKQLQYTYCPISQKVKSI